MIENLENPEEYKEELISPIIICGLESAVYCPDDLDVPSCVAGSGLSAREAVIVIYNRKYILVLVASQAQRSLCLETWEPLKFLKFPK